MKKIEKKGRLFHVFVPFLLLLAGCSGEPFLSTLKPQGENAATLFDLMSLTILLMTIVVVVVFVIFIYVSIKYRRTKQNENIIPKQVEGSHTLEMIWTVIPIFILLIIAIPTVAATFKLDPATEGIPEDALQINVTGKLYWWEFEYPTEGIITAQDLVIPVGEKVYINLKSGDVKHSFWVPTLAGKMDANTENENHMWIHAYEEGLYYGKCTELCGPSHALMDFKVKAVSKEEYNRWVSNMKKPPVMPTDSVVKMGQEIFAQNCAACHAVDVNDPRPEAGRIAPNLANFADRERVAGIKENTVENIEAWLKNPEEIKPGNKMTNAYQLNDDEIHAVTQYLLTLSKE